MRAYMLGIRLTPSEKERLSLLQKEGGFTNFSEVVRALIANAHPGVEERRITIVTSVVPQLQPT